MKLAISVLNIFVLASAHIASASEIDSFTQRYEFLPDAKQEVDAMANRHIREAVERTNKGATQPCSDEVLYNELRESFNIIMAKGKYIEEMLNTDKINRRQVPRKESVFMYHSFWDGPLLVNQLSEKKGIGMGSMLNYDGYYIGTDKFEHMFGPGFIYFKAHYIDERSKEEVLRQSWLGEKVLRGGNNLLTGVFSYADLVANFNGIRFWNDMLKEAPDLLGRELDPVIACENDEFVVKRNVTFSDYVDSGLDEAINCSTFSTQNGLKGVNRRLKELKAKDPQNAYGCPIDKNKVEELKVKYHPYVEWLFNFDPMSKHK